VCLFKMIKRSNWRPLSLIATDSNSGDSCHDTKKRTKQSKKHKRPAIDFTAKIIIIKVLIYITHCNSMLLGALYTLLQNYNLWAFLLQQRVATLLSAASN